MQQILKKGTKIPPNKRIYFKKCRTCGCKFTYQEKDTIIKKFVCMEHGKNTVGIYYIIKTLHCQEYFINLISIKKN